MALMRVQFYSDALGVSTSMTVLLPQPASSQIGMAAVAGDEPPQLLYLLHGLSDDDTIWTRRTALERHVAGHDLAVVMPAVNRSFYTDEAYGAAYWRFVSEELPSLVHRFFRVSDRPEDTFVAGLSRGGYGALKWALTHPDRFAAAASMSGALDVVTAVGNRTFEMDPAMWRRIFGEQGPPPASDLFALAERTPPADLPPLWIGCGTADHLWDANQRFVTHLDGLGISPTLSWVDGAAHEWSLWDRDIEQLMSWLPLRRSAGADG